MVVEQVKEYSMRSTVFSQTRLRVSEQHSAIERPMPVPVPGLWKDQCEMLPVAMATAGCIPMTSPFKIARNHTILCCTAVWCGVVCPRRLRRREVWIHTTNAIRHARRTTTVRRRVHAVVFMPCPYMQWITVHRAYYIFTYLHRVRIHNTQYTIHILILIRDERHHN